MQPVQTTGVNWESAGVIVAIISVIVIPFFAWLARTVRGWAKFESRIETVVEDVKALVEDKTRAHAELARTLERVAGVLDERVRYLEENFWSKRPPRRVR